MIVLALAEYRSISQGELGKDRWTMKRVLTAGFPFRWALLAMVIIGFIAIGCSSKEEKRDAFFQKGSRLFEKGEYTKAVLEFKNAIQLDPKMAPAYYHLGLAYLKDRKPEKAFGGFQKAVEIDPTLFLARLEMADLLVSARQSDRALETLQPILTGEAKNDRALLIAAKANLASKKADEALKLLSTCNASSFDHDLHIELLYSLANAYHQKGEAGKAKEYLLRVHKESPESANAYLILSNIYLNEKKPDKAEEEIRSLIQQNKENPDYQVLLCRFFAETGQKEKADAEYGRLTEANPQNNSLLLSYGHYLFKEQDLEKALTLVQRAISNDADAWEPQRLYAEILLAKKEPEQALAHLDAYLARKEPEGKADALLAKSEILLSLNKWDDAGNVVGNALKIESNNAKAHLLKGKVLLHQGEFNDAVMHLRQATTSKPDDPEGHFLLAQAFARSGKSDLEIEAIRNGIERIPDNIPLRLALVRYYQQKKQWDLALQAVDRALEKQPGMAVLNIQKGRVFAAMGKLDKAEQVFRALIQESPDLAVGYLELGMLKNRQKNSVEAIRLFKEAATKQGNRSVALKLLLETYVSTGQVESAKTLCRENLQEEPGNAFLLNAMGSILLFQKSYVEAEAMFQQAIDAGQDWEEPYYNLAKVYSITDRLPEAATKLQAIFDRQPDNVRSGFTLSLIYGQQGKSEKAIEILERLIKLQPDVPLFNNNLAFMYSEYRTDKKILKKASEYAAKAVQKDEDNPQFLDTAAWIEYKSGNFEKARGFIDRAIGAADKDSIILYHAGRIHAEIGEKKRAKEYLSKAMEMGLKGEEAKTTVALIGQL